MNTTCSGCGCSGGKWRHARLLTVGTAGLRPCPSNPSGGVLRYSVVVVGCKTVLSAMISHVVSKAGSLSKALEMLLGGLAKSSHDRELGGQTPHVIIFSGHWDVPHVRELHPKNLHVSCRETRLAVQSSSIGDKV